MSDGARRAAGARWATWVGRRAAAGGRRSPPRRARSRPAAAASATRRWARHDSFVVVAPVPPRDGAAVKSKSGLPVVATVALDDPHAVPLHQQFAIGFAGEVLRTDYLAKQLVREIEVGGRRYSDGQRASAREPTVLVMGGARPGAPATSRGVALKGSFGGEDEHADALAVAVDAYPDHDRALPQTLAGALGLLAASRVAGIRPRRTPRTRW